MKNFSIVIQASSISWSGGSDLCMNEMNGKPILYWTIQSLVSKFGSSAKEIWLVAPSFDEGGLDFIAHEFSKHNIRIYYGNDDSPLLRMVEASKALNDSDLIVRVHGLNFCVDTEALENNIDLAVETKVDCVRFPDDFPALFSGDVYRVSALRQMTLSKDLIVESKYHVHPKYFLGKNAAFSAMVSIPNMQKYTDEFLKSTRQKCKDSLHAKRIDVDSTRSISSGDTISFHYRLALDYIDEDMDVIDLACGSGFGAYLLGSKAKKVVGIDNDSNVIQHAKNRANIIFKEADALNMPVELRGVDAVIAFEIIEHLNPDELMKSIKLVLKPGGLLILSTPQNSMGHIPTTPDHEIEFSLNGLKEIVSRHFNIKTVIGIKQGTIFFDADPIGANTFMVAVNE
jgi:SAM-dependent methyltransferase